MEYYYRSKWIHIVLNHHKCHLVRTLQICLDIVGLTLLSKKALEWLRWRLLYLRRRKRNRHRIFYSFWVVLIFFFFIFCKWSTMSWMVKRKLFLGSKKKQRRRINVCYMNLYLLLLLSNLSKMIEILNKIYFTMNTVNLLKTT
jgi:hypothetical protein